MFAYIVKCSFAPNASSVADDWLAWLSDQHLVDVMEAGALSAEVIELDSNDYAEAVQDPGPIARSFEIHYRFSSRADFESYESRHAPRLRAEGLAKFPLALGLTYHRATGEILAKSESKSG